MKRNILFISVAFSILLLMNGCFALQRIKGDGDIITEMITIDNYDVIQVSNGSIKVTYSQSDETPSLTVTTDRNIFDKYDIRTEGNILKILPKPEYKQAAFFPTEFTVITHSQGLKKVEIAGSVEFNTENTLTADRLELKLAGSGIINLHDSVLVDKLDVDLAGSATVNVLSVYGRELSGDIAGSGKLNLGGAMQKASFDIAGKSDIRGFDFRVEDLNCDIAGSGDIEMSVSNSIRADVAGRGRIRYKGNPQEIKKNTAGSTSIKKVD